MLRKLYNSSKKKEPEKKPETKDPKKPRSHHRTRTKDIPRASAGLKEPEALRISPDEIVVRPPVRITDKGHRVRKMKVTIRDPRDGKVLDEFKVRGLINTVISAPDNRPYVITMIAIDSEKNKSKKIITIAANENHRRRYRRKNGRPAAPTFKSLGSALQDKPTLKFLIKQPELDDAAFEAAVRNMVTRSPSVMLPAGINAALPRDSLITRDSFGLRPEAPYFPRTLLEEIKMTARNAFPDVEIHQQSAVAVSGAAAIAAITRDEQPHFEGNDAPVPFIPSSAAAPGVTKKKVSVSDTFSKITRRLSGAKLGAAQALVAAEQHQLQEIHSDDETLVQDQMSSSEEEAEPKPDMSKRKSQKRILKGVSREDIMAGSPPADIHLLESLEDLPEKRRNRTVGKNNVWTNDEDSEVHGSPQVLAAAGVYQEDIDVVFYTSTTHADHFSEGNERRLLHLLDTKGLMYTIVFVDLDENHHQRRRMTATSGITALPQLHVAGTFIGTYESIQQMEDEGVLDAKLESLGLKVIRKRSKSTDTAEREEDDYPPDDELDRIQDQLPEGWFAFRDESSKQIYFFNEADQTTTWDSPITLESTTADDQSFRPPMKRSATSFVIPPTHLKYARTKETIDMSPPEEQPPDLKPFLVATTLLEREGLFTDNVTVIYDSSGAQQEFGVLFMLQEFIDSGMNDFLSSDDPDYKGIMCIQPETTAVEAAKPFTLLNPSRFFVKMTADIQPCPTEDVYRDGNTICFARSPDLASIHPELAEKVHCHRKENAVLTPMVAILIHDDELITQPRSAVPPEGCIEVFLPNDHFASDFTPACVSSAALDAALTPTAMKASQRPREDFGAVYVSSLVLVQHGIIPEFSSTVRDEDGHDASLVYVDKASISRDDPTEDDHVVYLPTLAVDGLAPAMNRAISEWNEITPVYVSSEALSEAVKSLQDDAQSATSSRRMVPLFIPTAELACHGVNASVIGCIEVGDVRDLSAVYVDESVLKAAHRQPNADNADSAIFVPTRALARYSLKLSE